MLFVKVGGEAKFFREKSAEKALCCAVGELI
jgi:hypothetical protein